MISINPLHSHFSFSPTVKKESGKNKITIAKEKKLQELMEVSKSFEALLIKEVFKSMEKNLKTRSLLGNNSATKLFKDFLSSEHSQMVANQNQLGVAKSIFEQQSKFL